MIKNQINTSELIAENQRYVELVAKQYLDWCAANGYTPKFDMFADDPNYYKLLEDFTLYDKDGKYVDTLH